MSEHLNFEDAGGSTETTVTVDHALQQYQGSNKRKRDASDHGNDVNQAASKRTANNNAINVNGNGNGHSHGQGHGHDVETSRVMYPENLQNSSGASQDFSAISQHLARHAANAANHHVHPDVPASSTAAAALAGIMPQLTVPQPTELSFVSTGSGTDGERQIDSSFDLGADNSQNHNVQGSPYGMGGFQGTAAQVQNARETSNGAPKPPVGSEEWHKQRRDNHKEVERRRRETINEGINELAKIVPGCEKNKGSILQRAVQYIQQLKDNEESNIQKWTMEKLCTEQAITALTLSLEKVRAELDHAWSEAKRWEEQARSRELEIKADDDAGGTDDEADA